MPKGRGSAILVAGVVLAATVMAQTSAGHSLLRKAGLFAVPAHYTALAFTHPQSLTSQLGSEHAALSVSFLINNVSDTSRRYRWSILLMQGKHTRRMAAGAVRAPAHGKATISRTVATSCASGQVRVVVRLTAPVESIDFMARCWSGDGSIP